MVRRLLHLTLLGLLLTLAGTAGAASRYFADRAGAPVRWEAWGSRALERAKKEKRPIFLSIGFGSSYECYRMHREAFLNGENAETLNTHFIPILLDRLEHPEVAEAYEAAAREMSGAEGLPVQLVLNAALEPFAAAGSLNAEELSRFLVIAANRFAETGGKDTYRPSATPRPAAPPDSDAVVDAIAKTWKPKSSSFGEGPLRPRPMTISFLLRYATRTAHDQIRDVALESLRRMAVSAIRDQLGGGFHRAARDEEWSVPFFEKMLPDQALAAMAYLDAWSTTRDPEMEHLVRTTLDFVLRDMREGRGAFDASQAAYNFVPLRGPELVNGNFYHWQKDEITRLLGRETASKVFTIYGMKDEQPNLPALAEWRFLPETHDELSAPLEKMLEIRQKRPEPPREFNVITGWNGLMISALARAGTVLGEKRYIEAATSAASAVTEAHWNARRKALRRSDAADALAEDYAFLVQALLDLYGAGQDVRWFELAVTLQQRQDELFWDASSGSYATGRTAPAPLRTLVEESDDATPAANSVAALNLLRLAALTGNRNWSERSGIIFAAFGGRMRARGAELAQMATAYELSRVAPSILVVTGDARMKATWDLLHTYAARAEPMQALVLLPHRGAARDRVVRALPFTAALLPDEKEPVAYLCAAGECKRR